MLNSFAAYACLRGTSDVSRDLLKISNDGSAKMCAKSCSFLGTILSGSEALCILMSSSSFNS